MRTLQSEGVQIGGSGWSDSDGTILLPQTGAGSEPLTSSAFAVPVAINSDTQYGVSLANYGLGPNYQSEYTLATQSQVASAAPSVWWLVIALAIVVFLT